MEGKWHSFPVEEIFRKLDTSENGLKNSEARRRLAKYGTNEIASVKRASFFLMFLSQFKSPLVYILLLAAILTYFLQHAVDTWVILAIVFFNAFFGLLHEIKAEKAMAALSKLMILKAKVKREGVLQELPSVELVPGDIVEVSSGVKIPADLRIIEANNLRIDEAILTGESIPQEKKEGILSSQTLLGDRTNMLYGGTLVISGNASGIVVATGNKTEFGKIAEEVMKTPKIQTPLQSKLAKFAQKILFIVLAAVFIIFLTGILKGFDFLQMLLTAISAAISAIPEGLPAIITITLATGAFQMAKRKAITRKLLAVETLGAVTVIASDKTGTLTHNQMTVERIYTFPSQKPFQVSGSGYEPKGEFKPNPDEGLLKILTYGVLCNNSEIFEENSEWGVIGDPTEAAIISAAGKAGISKEKAQKQFPRLDEIPFETENGYMATLNRVSSKKNLIVVKGKIEKILSMTDLDEDQKEKIISAMEDFAQSSLRVIAFAYKEVDREVKELSQNDLLSLKFLGFFGMIDPPRKEVFEAIKACQESGIRPLMITGDYSITAKAIAKEIGIIDSKNDGVVSGEELEKLSSKDFDETLKKYSVYARISPEMKLKIVEGLQREGNIVAVTGDGINDAPALKKADIGVAMGEGGTDVSREVADLVLSDNNFATIVAAIEEGRTVFQNIRRSVFYLLATNAGELFIIFVAMILLPFPYNLPLIPVQILWLNLVTDGVMGLSLALEPTHEGVLKYPPRSPKEGVLDKISFWRLILIAVVMLLGTFLLYSFEIKAGADINRARTIAFMTMLVFQIVNVLNCRSLKNSIFSTPFFTNRYILLAMISSFGLALLTVYSPFIRNLFHTVPLSTIDWVKIILVSLTIILAVEIEKFIRRKTNAKY